MQNFLNRIDELGAINSENRTALRLERAAFIFLILMVLFAPHSIAVSQTSFVCGMLAWLIRLFVKPRPKFVKTPLDFALWAFFAWSFVTSIFSYTPLISIDKMRGVALFLIFYFVVNNVHTKRAAIFLALALIVSCMVNVLLVPIERIIGRGVEIHGVSGESPLTKALLFDGDTLLKANGKKIRAPEDLAAQLEQIQTVKVEVYRPDFYFTVDVKGENLLSGASGAEKLGIENWKKSHNWRSTGFFGHWTTYGEVLQLIASLVFGLLIAFLTQKRKNTEAQIEAGKNNFLLFTFYFLLFALGAMAFALLLNGTRASQGGLLLSAFAIVLLNGNRKIILALVAVSIPLIIGGSVYLQQTRNTSFIDEKDDSTKYRQTVYREAFNLWTQNPRHFLIGVGMDSIKKYAGEWQLFDNGKLPLGHFHSTPLQLAVERGLPALLLWISILWLYARMLWRGVFRAKLLGKTRFEQGILLGIFGGLIGFAASGLVHYNLGDQEVTMIFFLLMGLGFVLSQDDNGTRTNADSVNLHR